MRQKFSIAKLLLAACVALLVLGVVAGVARGRRPGARRAERYTVQKGDTLWGIAGKFLKDPWRWPDIWRHEPRGDQESALDLSGRRGGHEHGDGKPRLSLERDGKPASARSSASADPRRQCSTRDDRPPFAASSLLAARHRGDSVHSGRRPRALPFAAAHHRPGRARRCRRDRCRPRSTRRPRRRRRRLRRRHRSEGRRPLVHLPPGPDVRVVRQRARHRWDTSSASSAAPRSSASATCRPCASPAREEILVGDQLVPAPRGQLINYVPHAPDRPINGRIIALERRRGRGGPRLDRHDRQGRAGRHRRRHRARDLPRVRRRSATRARRKSRTSALPVSDRTNFVPARPLPRSSRRAHGPRCSSSAYSTACRTRLLVRTADPIVVGNYVRKP